MTLSLRAAAIASVMVVVASTSVMAQTTGAIPTPDSPSQLPPPPTANQYSSNDIIDAGHRFFGGVSRDLAEIVEKAVSQWGLPNGYILGEEASGAFIGGLRYGDGTLYTRNAGDVRVFWEGPSFGFDFGADGARTMMLVYSLPRTGAIFNRFGGINGSAYLVGGFGMTALTGNNMVVVPIRSGTVCDLEPISAGLSSPTVPLGTHSDITNWLLKISCRDSRISVATRLRMSALAHNRKLLELCAISAPPRKRTSRLRRPAL